MKHFVISLACLVLLSASLFAQKVSDPIPLTIHPADLPQPSLKYRLFPERGQLSDGNAPTQYYRALSLLVENPELLKELQADYWSKWLTLPLKDLPRKEVAEKGAHGPPPDPRTGDRQQTQAMRLAIGSSPGRHVPADARSARLPQYGQAARRPRARLYIAESKYTEACETLQIGYALAHHMGQGPTRIHVLVGMAIARVMTDQVETLLQQPDAPNLYWSLTVLPKPFADLRPVLEQETLLLETMFPWIKQLDTTPLSEEQVKAVQEKLANANRDFNVRPPNVGERARLALTLTRTAAEGKRELVARYQFTKEQVAAMPSFQVATLYAYREYKEAGAEVVKWSHVPEGWKYPDTRRRRNATTRRGGGSSISLSPACSTGLANWGTAKRPPWKACQ